MTNDASTCQVCANERAVVVVADADLSERAVCGTCWHRLERLMTVTLVRFAPPYGRVAT